MKYKVWDKLKNDWYVPTFEAYRGKLEHLVLNQDGSLNMITLTENIHESMFPDRFEVIQSTGLEDKNGVEIFEGDILFYILYNTHSNDRVVEFEDGAYYGVLVRNQFPKILSDINTECKIIGNIYENPELLEK